MDTPKHPHLSRLWGFGEIQRMFEGNVWIKQFFITFDSWILFLYNFIIVTHLVEMRYFAV